MEIAVIILCRFNSSRLPGKILKTIQGKTILDHIVSRVKKVFPPEQIIVATSMDSTDEPIVTHCKQQGLQYYRGDLSNVSERFLKAAQSVNATYAIRINGDNIFVDIPLLEDFKELITQNNFDFISNVKDRTYPKGMSIEAVKVDFYQNQFTHFLQASDFEHVTSYLYEHLPKNSYFFYNKNIPKAAGIQLAIDTPEDFEIATMIMREMNQDPLNYGLEDIYKLYKKLTH